MKHYYSKTEKEYLEDFKGCTIDPATFHHKEHLLITYTLLIDHNINYAYQCIKQSILNFLKHVGADNSKYHETMTYGWVLIIKHFMIKTESCTSFTDFLSKNEILLDTNILFKHYSKELIASKESRIKIQEADIKEIKLD